MDASPLQKGQILPRSLVEGGTAFWGFISQTGQGLGQHHLRPWPIQSSAGTRCISTRVARTYICWAGMWAEPQVVRGWV